VSASASRALTTDLPENVAAAVAHLITGDLLRRPRHVGKPLQREYSGLWCARRGEYRVIYSIDEELRTVTVRDVAHRGRIYRRR
jgi:mRNA-degrading endonuclease RelE of RelBE toxin-antitoxin system